MGFRKKLKAIFFKKYFFLDFAKLKLWFFRKVEESCILDLLKFYLFLFIYFAVLNLFIQGFFALVDWLFYK